MIRTLACLKCACLRNLVVHFFLTKAVRAPWETGARSNHRRHMKGTANSFRYFFRGKIFWSPGPPVGLRVEYPPWGQNTPWTGCCYEAFINVCMARRWLWTECAFPKLSNGIWHAYIPSLNDEYRYWNLESQRILNLAPRSWRHRDLFCDVITGSLAPN